MRVVIDGAPLLGHPTGIGVFTSGLLKSLAGRPELQVDAFALSGRSSGRISGLVPPGVAAIGKPMPAGLLLRAWQRWDGPVVEKWTGPAQVVHGTNFVVPPARHAARLMTVHDLTSTRYPQLCTAVTLRYPTMIRRALEGGAHVHVLSKSIRDEVVAQFSVDEERVHQIPPGITPRARSTAKSPVDGEYVLAIGTIEPRKDHALLVEAFTRVAAEHPDLRLVVAGADGWALDAFEDALEKSPFRDRIVRLGWVSDADRQALLDNAAVLAYPSIYEGFGLPPLEAMQVGVPVVATAISAVRELVGEAGLLVPPGEPDALAAAIVTALEDSETRTRIVDAGRFRAALFDWDQTGKNMAGLYERLHEERSS